MKKIAGILLFCSLVFILSGCCSARKKTAEETFGNTDKNEVVPPQGYLKVGETFHYKVGWLSLDVGSASLSVKEKQVMDGREVYVVYLTTSTNKFFSFFYNVKGEVFSYIDAVTLKPVKHDSETIINKKTVFKKITYDFKKNIAYSEDKKGHHEITIPDGVLDPLGVFYYFSLKPFVVNQPIEFVINGGKKNFPVTVFVKTIKTIKIPAGIFDAFLVEPTLDSERQFDEILNAQGRMRIWFSADERRIPLMITLKVPVGTAKAILNEIEYTESNDPESRMNN
ncbi:MAG: DUF3108 domain-containing protein [Candidatus Omnitrophota bacterium]